MEAIRTENLTYIYSPGTPFEMTAVNDVSISIKQGELVGIIGHTGSGKSTIIQHLNGLLRPSFGKVFINGRDIWADPSKIRQVRFEVGLVFQYPEYQLFEETVYKDIAFGPGNMGLSQNEIDERVREAAFFTGLSDELMPRSPFELSGGQKRRVAIAGILAMRPNILILDEPTAGLDPNGREQILDEISNYHTKTGSTVLLVSHSMEDIARFANRVLVVSEGGIYAYGSVDEVFSKTKELTGMGLSIPQISSIFLKLHEKGAPVSRHIYTLEAAQTELLRIAGREAENRA